MGNVLKPIQCKSLVLDAIGTLVHFSGFSYYLFLPLELLLPLTDIVLNTNVIEMRDIHEKKELLTNLHSHEINKCS